MSFKEHYNLVTVDYPSILVEDFVNKKISNIDADLIILYYGGKGEIKRDERIEKKLKLLFNNTFFIHYQLKHAVCTSYKGGNKYMNYLRANSK